MVSPHLNKPKKSKRFLQPMERIRESHKWSKCKVYIYIYIKLWGTHPYSGTSIKTTGIFKAPGTSRKRRWKYSKRLRIGKTAVKYVMYLLDMTAEVRNNMVDCTKPHQLASQHELGLGLIRSHA